MIQFPVVRESAGLASIVAIIAGVWGGFHPLIQCLITLIVIDIFSGLILAKSSGEISSDASFKGMGKKAMMLLLVGAAHTYNATQPLGFDAGVAVAAFFCTTELISIIENAGRIGLPIPRVLIDALEKLQRGNSGEPKS